MSKRDRRHFYSLQVVSRWRDSQLEASENDSDLTKTVVGDFEILLIDLTFYLQSWYFIVSIKNIKKTNILGNGGERLSQLQTHMEPPLLIQMEIARVRLSINLD